MGSFKVKTLFLLEETGTVRIPMNDWHGISD